MAFTGVLGSTDANLSNFKLGAVSSGGGSPTSVSQALSLAHAVIIGHDTAVHATQTLTLAQNGTNPVPLTPIVGYSGSQTRYVVVRDLTFGFNLYELNPDTVFDYPASTTKLMTAYLIYQYKSTVLDTQTVTFTTADVTLPGGISYGGFLAGDTCTWRQLLYAIFVASAGDACQCAARIIGHEIYVAAGSTGLDGMPRFIQVMNNQAATFGMTNATYYDPWGYSGPGYNSISARDCNTISIHTLTIAAIATIAQTPTYSLTTGGGSPHTLNWVNVNRFVNGPTLNQSSIADTNSRGGKVGEWTASGSHLNLAQIWQAPNGNLIAITTMNSESYLAMTFDQQGIIYSILRDWPYLEDTTSQSDTLFSNVKMLVGGDGSLIDESSVARTLSHSSGATLSTPVIASTGGIHLAATSDSVYSVTGSDIEIGSGDATIEVWYAGDGSTSPGEYAFLSKLGSSSQREYVLEYYSGNLSLYASGDGSTWTSSNAMPLNSYEVAVFFNGAPRHIAFVKSGSTISGYINGERTNGTITVATIATTGASAGIGIVGAAASAIGEYDDYRATIGNARYSANKETIFARKFPRTSSPNQTASSTLTLTGVATVSITSNHLIPQTLTFAQLGARTELGSGSSTLTFTQSTTEVKYKIVSASNALVLSHDLERLMSYGRSIFQGLPMGNIPFRNMSYARFLPQTLILSQVDVGIDTKLATSTLTFTQSGTAVISHGGSNHLTLTQVPAISITKLEHIYDLIIPFQSATEIGQHNKLIPQTLVLTQVLTGNVTKNATQHLSLTQAATGVNVKAGFSDLLLFDFASETHTSNVRGSSSLILNAAVTVQKTISRFASHAWSADGYAKATRTIPVPAGNFLTLAEALVQRYWNESTPQELTFTQSAVAHKVSNDSIVSSLALAQTISLAKTLHRTVNDTLIFQPYYQKYVGVSLQPYVPIPPVQAVVLGKNRIFTLEAPGLAIVLPWPAFNDAEAGTARLNVKRSMDGTRRVYRRDSPVSKLKYDFVMDRKKAIELRNFILSNNSTLLKVTNHKAEIWYAILTNNPFTFVEAAYWASSWGNKSTVTLELEGSRVN